MPSTPLFKPRAFFEERTPSLLGAAVILYAAGIFAVSTGAPYVGQLTDVDPSPRMLVIGVLVGGAVGAAGIWITFTVIVYLVTAVVGGSGPLRKTAANVGWGLLPLLIVNALYGLIVWSLFAGGQLPMISPATLQEPLWLRLVNVTTSVIGYIWIGWLLTYAIHDARNVSVRRAGAIAGVIVAASLILQVSQVV